MNPCLLRLAFDVLLPPQSVVTIQLWAVDLLDCELEEL